MNLDFRATCVVVLPRVLLSGVTVLFFVCSSVISIFFFFFGLSFALPFLPFFPFFWFLVVVVVSSSFFFFLVAPSQPLIIHSSFLPFA